MPATRSWGSGLQRPGPECHSGIARVRAAFGFSAAFRAIELADRVSANFDDAVLRAFAFILARAHGSLHHHVRTFSQGSRELGLPSKETMRCQCVRLCHLPSASFQDSLVA